MEFLLKGGSEKLYFPSANTAPETACEELSEGAQPVFILLHLHQETENGQIHKRVFSFLVLKFQYDIRDTPWAPGMWWQGQGQYHLFCSQQEPLGDSTCGHTWGQELAPRSCSLQLNLLPPEPHRKESCFPPVEQNLVCPSCDPAPSVAAVYSRFSVVQLGVWFVSSQRTLLTNAPQFSIKEVRGFWILFFLKKWLILHTVFLHLSLIYDALIEAGGVCGKFLFKFS